MKPVSGAEADRLASEQSRFEKSKEPPMTADTHFAAGQLAESQGAFAQAIEQYKEALKLNPKHLQALYRTGIVYAQVKQYPEAIETWKKYVKATHESAFGYSNLGFCHELAGQPEDAERAYQRGIEKDSANAPCRINYGLMLARRDRMNEAERQLQAALSPAEVHYNLASVFESKGRKEQARQEYQKAIQLDPKFQDAQARLDALN